MQFIPISVRLPRYFKGAVSIEMGGVGPPCLADAHVSRRPTSSSFRSSLCVISIRLIAFVLIYLPHYQFLTHCKCFGFCIAYSLGDFYAKAPRRTLIPRSPTCLSLRARCPLPSAFRRGSELPLRTGTDKPRPKIGTRHLLESKYLNWWTRDCNSWRSGRQVGMARAARQGPAGRRQPAAGERTRPRTASQAAGPSKK